MKMPGAWWVVAAFLSATCAGAEEQREMLSLHETVAVYEGTNRVVCRGRTALCPERCETSGDYAAFAIRGYVRYEKPGTYGDPKQERFQVRIADFHHQPAGDAKVAELLRGLKAGDLVRLDWRHDYVTRDGSSSPERPLVRLEKIGAADAEALLRQASAP